MPEDDLNIDKTTWKIGFTSGGAEPPKISSNKNQETREASIGSVGFLEFSLSAENAILAEYDTCEFMVVIPLSEEKTLNVDCERVETAHGRLDLKTSSIDFTAENGFSENGEYSAFPALKMSHEEDLVTFDLLSDGQNPLTFKIGAAAEPAPAEPSTAPLPDLLAPESTPVPPPSPPSPSAASVVAIGCDDILSTTYSSVKSEDDVIGSAKAAFIKPGKVRISICLTDGAGLGIDTSGLNKIRIHSGIDESVFVKASILTNESNLDTGAVSILSDKISDDILSRFKGKVLSVSCKVGAGMKVDRSPLYIPTGALSTKSVKFKAAGGPAAIKTKSSTIHAAAASTTSTSTITGHHSAASATSHSTSLTAAMLIAFLAVVLIAFLFLYYIE